MKKFFLSLCVALVATGFAMAQDMASVVESFNAAATALNEKNYESALTQFNTVLEQATALGEEGAEVANNCKESIPKILLQLGKAAAEAKDFDAAVDFFNKATDKALDFANNDAVVAEAQKLVPQMLNAKAGALLNAKDYAAAVEVYKAIVEKDEANGAAWFRMGQALAADDKADEAVEAFTKAAENGQEANAKKQLANIYLKKAVACQKEKDMKGMLENAQLSAQNNDSANAQKLIGTAALSLKQNQVAAEAFEAYLALNPEASDKAQTIYQIGTAYMGAGNNGKACSYFKQIKSDAKWGEAATYYITTLKCN